MPLKSKTYVLNIPLGKRFWSKVNKNGKPYKNLGPCWEWLSTKCKRGYGSYRHEGKWLKAHRFSYTELRGEIPPTMTLDHLCRNTSCVNPDHLEIVTSEVNTKRHYETVVRCHNGHEYTEDNTVLREAESGYRRRCLICMDANQEKFKRKFKINPKQSKPTKEVLAEELKITTFSDLGRKYGVTDNAVRKWAKNYGILPPPRPKSANTATKLINNPKHSKNKL